MRVREALSACDEVRERVWVARVLSGDEWPVLLVCGADHAVSVSALFKCTGKRIGVQATVLTGAPSDIGRIVTKMIHVDAGRRIGQQLSSFRRELPDATSDPLRQAGTAKIEQCPTHPVREHRLPTTGKRLP